MLDLKHQRVLLAKRQARQGEVREALYNAMDTNMIGGALLAEMLIRHMSVADLEYFVRSEDLGGIFDDAPPSL